MAKTQAKLDKDTGRGMLLAALLIGGVLGVGTSMAYFWNARSGQLKAEARQTHYLTLGEQRLAVGNNSMLIQLSVEYVGAETGKVLNKALPRLKDDILRQLSQLQNSDVDRLRTPQGKKALAGKVLETVREFVPDEDAGSVKGILYEKFLIGE